MREPSGDDSRGPLEEVDGNDRFSIVDQVVNNTSPPPHADLMSPISVRCPKCDTDFGALLRVTLVLTWSACQCLPVPETHLVCLSCRKVWVAGLCLPTAAYAVEGRVA